MGEQPLTEVRVEVAVDGKPSDRHEVRTGLREIAVEDWVFSVNGERLFPKGANLAPTALGPVVGDARRPCAATSSWRARPASTWSA